MVYLYGHQRYAAAYAWACALLVRLCVLREGTSSLWQATDSFPVHPCVQQTKREKSLSTSSMARESLDTALRCMLKTQRDGAWVWDDRALSIVAAAFERVRIGQREYDALVTEGVVNGAVAKRCLVRPRSHQWTTLPGLATTVGEVCLRSGHDRSTCDD